AACDLAAEHQGHNAAGHVLVDASERDGLYCQPSFLVGFPAQAILDGLIQLQDAAGWLPLVVVAPLDEQRLAAVVGDDGCDASGVAWGVHVITSPGSLPT